MSKKLIDRDKAFEVYFTLGASRSIAKLHDSIAQRFPKIAPSLKTLKNWSKKERWQDRVLLRDNAVRDGIQESATIAAVNSKINELEQLDKAMNEIDAVMPMIFSALQSCMVTDPETGKKRVKIIPETTQDMTALYTAQTRFVTAKVKLVETMRKIMGESDAVNITHSVKMYDFDKDKYPEPAET